MSRALRRTVDIVAATAAIALAAGAGWYIWTEVDRRQDMKNVSEELRRFQQVLAFQAASGQAQVSSRGWPMTVDPAWFGDSPPRNPLVSQDRPWLEIATLDQAQMSDPPIRIAVDRSLAMFWYNPFQGVVRARVSMQISDQRSLMLYNEANGTSVSTLYELGTPARAVEPDPQRAATAPDD